MAMKEDPRDVKRRDQLASILSRIPGVEPVPCHPGSSPEGACDLDAVIWSSPDHDSATRLPTTICPRKRPIAGALTTSTQGAEFERAVRGVVEALRRLLAGARPSDYRPLHMPMHGFGVAGRAITLDGVPARVLVSWDLEQGAVRITCDALRPETISPEVPEDR